MKKCNKYIIIPLFCFLSLVVSFLLMNCTSEQQPSGTGGDFGFTPDSPTTDNSEGLDDYELDPIAPTRGGVVEYFSVSDNQDQYNHIYNPDDPNAHTTGQTTGSAGQTTGSTGQTTGSTGQTTGSTGQTTGSTTGSCTPPSFLYKNNIVLDNEARWGTSAPITITDNSVFEDFRLGEPVNSMRDIKNLRVYIKLSKVSGQRYYAGMVTVAYQDYGRGNKPNRRIRFQSGGGANAQYNIWLNRYAFHGFFQEEYGALILVIDDTDEVDCGPDQKGSVTVYSGSIWTMQFRTTFRGKNSCNNHDQQYVFEYNQNLPFGRERIPTLSERNRKCWFLTSGPFDCRTWRTSNGVNTFRGIYPSNCYTKLATFKGLDILKAFGVRRASEIQR